MVDDHAKQYRPCAARKETSLHPNLRTMEAPTFELLGGDKFLL